MKNLKDVFVDLVDYNILLNMDICTKLYGKMHQGHAEMTAYPKVETGS